MRNVRPRLVSSLASGASITSIGTATTTSTKKNTAKFFEWLGIDTVDLAPGKVDEGKLIREVNLTVRVDTQALRNTRVEFQHEIQWFDRAHGLQR